MSTKINPNQVGIRDSHLYNSASNHQKKPSTEANSNPFASSDDVFILGPVAQAATPTIPTKTLIQNLVGDDNKINVDVQKELIGRGNATADDLLEAESKIDPNKFSEHSAILQVMGQIGGEKIEKRLIEILANFSAKILNLALVADLLGNMKSKKAVESLIESHGKFNSIYLEVSSACALVKIIDAPEEKKKYVDFLMEKKSDPKCNEKCQKKIDTALAESTATPAPSPTAIVTAPPAEPLVDEKFIAAAPAEPPKEKLVEEEPASTDLVAPPTTEPVTAPPPGPVVPTPIPPAPPVIDNPVAAAPVESPTEKPTETTPENKALAAPPTTEVVKGPPPGPVPAPPPPPPPVEEKAVAAAPAEPPKEEAKDIDHAEYSGVDLTFEDGVYNGSGQIKYPDGSVYKGSIIKSLPSGNGEMADSNGDHYSGQWLDGKKDGYGTFTTTSGDKYIGDFASGGPDGNGEFISADQTLYHEGLFNNGAIVPEPERNIEEPVTTAARTPGVSETNPASLPAAEPLVSAAAPATAPSPEIVPQPLPISAKNKDISLTKNPDVYILLPEKDNSSVTLLQCGFADEGVINDDKISGKQESLYNCDLPDGSTGKVHLSRKRSTGSGLYNDWQYRFGKQKGTFASSDVKGLYLLPLKDGKISLNQYKTKKEIFETVANTLVPSDPVPAKSLSILYKGDDKQTIKRHACKPDGNASFDIDVDALTDTVKSLTRKQAYECDDQNKATATEKMLMPPEGNAIIDEYRCSFPHQWNWQLPASMSATTDGEQNIQFFSDYSDAPLKEMNNDTLMSAFLMSSNLFTTAPVARVFSFDPADPDGVYNEGDCKKIENQCTATSGKVFNYELYRDTSWKTGENGDTIFNVKNWEGQFATSKKGKSIKWSKAVEIPKMDSIYAIYDSNPGKPYAKSFQRESTMRANMQEDFENRMKKLANKDKKTPTVVSPHYSAEVGAGMVMRVASSNSRKVTINDIGNRYSEDERLDHEAAINTLPPREWESSMGQGALLSGAGSVYPLSYWAPGAHDQLVSVTAGANLGAYNGFGNGFAYLSGGLGLSFVHGLIDKSYPVDLGLRLNFLQVGYESTLGGRNGDVGLPSASFIAQYHNWILDVSTRAGDSGRDLTTSEQRTWLLSVRYLFDSSPGKSTTPPIQIK